MLKKRKRRKVNRRHTEPGLGAGDAPPVAPTNTPTAVNVATTSNTAPSETVAALLGGAGLPPSGTAGHASPSTGGHVRHHRPPTARSTGIRSDAAVGASQYVLHTQFAFPVAGQGASTSTDSEQPCGQSPSGRSRHQTRRLAAASRNATVPGGSNYERTELDADDVLLDAATAPD